ncbi:MAG: ThiF family adenylyltransferase [Brachybacterium sp.]|nr:ThiF family adenylyltransferase [Brachybacterium sp.]
MTANTAPFAQEHGSSARYLRQTRLPEVGAVGQGRLGAARLAVIGAGGLGSPVLAYLAAAGVGTRAGGGWITVLDPDLVDLTNLHRQVVHADAAQGQSKAESAAERMRTTNPEVDVRAVQEAVTTQNALELLGGHDLVIDGSDNFPTRYLVSDACEMLELPLVWGSILGFAGQLSVFDADAGRGVTYRDLHPVPPRPGEVPSCAEAGVMGPLCGVIGSAMAMESIKVLLGAGRSVRGRLALYDALEGRWQEVPISRDPDRAPVTELEDLTLTCGLPGADVPAAVDSGVGADGMDAAQVQVHEIADLLRAGTRVIDIREAEETADGVLAGAELIPSGVVVQDPAAGGDLDGAVLYCAAGRRSEAARRALAARGITVRSLVGGYAAIEAAGLPLTSPRPRR